MTKRLFLFLFAVTAMYVPTAYADELQTTAQSLIKKYDPALVRIHATGQVQQQGLGREFAQRDETSIAQAVIIDESGIAVASRTSFDASARVGVITFNTGGEEHVTEFKSKFKKIEMELADGSRVPARVLIVDLKWDLVVLVPKKPLKPGQFTYVPLKSTAQAEPLDDLIFLRRMSPLLNNQVAVDLASVSAILEKPVRMYYSGGMQPSLPAFNAKGELIGISAVQMPSLGEMISQGKSPSYAVLPCDYVNRVLEQARKNME